MPFVPLRVPASSQPQGAAALRRGDPRLDKVRAVFLPTNDVKDPSGAADWTLNNIVNAPHGIGLGAVTDQASNKYLVKGVGLPPTGWTLAVVFTPIFWPADGHSVIGFCQAPKSATHDRGLEIKAGGPAAYVYDGGPKYAPSSPATGLSGVTEIMVATCDGAKLRCYRNGKVRDYNEVAVSNYGYTGYTGTPSFSIGAASASNGQDDVELGLLCDTVWTDAQANAFLDSPWGIFEDEIYIWEPDAGVGAQNLTPSLVTNTNSFYAAAVATGAVNLTPGLFTNSNSFYSPSISVGAVDLTPNLFTSANSFYSHVVSLASGPQTLLPSLFSNSNSFYSASVTTGSVDLTPLLFTDSNSFYSPTVSLGGASLLPSLLSNTNSFYAPTVSPGLVNLVASLFTNSNTFYGHTVAQPSLQDLTPSLYSNPQAFYTHNISAGTTLSSADLLAIADAVWTHPEALTVAKFLGLK